MVNIAQQILLQRIKLKYVGIGHMIIGLSFSSFSNVHKALLFFISPIHTRTSIKAVSTTFFIKFSPCLLGSHRSYGSISPDQLIRHWQHISCATRSLHTRLVEQRPTSTITCITSIQRLNLLKSQWQNKRP